MKILAKIFIIIEVAFLFYTFFSKSSWFVPPRVLKFPENKKVFIDDNGFEYMVQTEASNVDALFREKKISLGEKDEVYPKKETELFPEMTISVNRPSQVKISVDGKIIENLSFSKTVADVLLENKVALSHLDKVDPPLPMRLHNDLKIVVTRIKTEEVTEEEPIDFKTIQEKDKAVDWGVKKVSQKGEKGTKENTYRINYEDGVQVSKIKLSSKITQNPINEIVSVGTKIRVGKSNSGIASWYGTDEVSCSSRDYPAGQWLRVTNLANGRQTYVKVEGYGPQAATGKLIDLSKDAFKQLAPLGQGTTRVKVEEILNKGFNPDL